MTSSSDSGLMPGRTGRLQRLSTLLSPDTDEAVRHHAAEFERWLRNVIVQPISGREELGSICPWAATALRLDTIHLTVCDSSDGPTALRTATEEAIRSFAATKPNHGIPAVHHITGVIVLPGMPDLNACLDAQQHDLKLYALQRGLMLGLFHPQRQRPSLTHAGALTLRSPVPAILVRNLMPQDRRIFSSDALPPRIRDERSAMYEAWMSGRCQRDPSDRDQR